MLIIPFFATYKCSLYLLLFNSIKVGLDISIRRSFLTLADSDLYIQLFLFHQKTLSLIEIPKTEFYLLFQSIYNETFHILLLLEHSYINE